MQTCRNPSTCFGIFRPSSGRYSGYFPEDGRNSERVRLYADQNVGLLIQKFVHSAHKVNFCVFCVGFRTNIGYFPILN